MASIPSDLARLAVRAGVGGVLAFDGYQKIQAWYRAREGRQVIAAPGEPATPPARTVGLVAGVSEAVGGVMLILGIATPGTGAAAASSMALTATAMKDKGQAEAGDFLIPAVLGVAASALALAGPGRLSVDHVIGNRLSNRPAALASLLATGSTTALAVLRRVRPTGAR
jgi:putative oxidoreductase